MASVVVTIVVIAVCGSGRSGGRRCVASGFLKSDEVGHGNLNAANIDRGFDFETNLRRSAVAAEAGDKILQRVDVGEEAIDVGVYIQRNDGVAIGVDGVGVGAGSGSELSAIDFHDPIHGGESCGLSGRVVHVDVDIHCQGHVLASDSGGQFENVGGRYVAIGDVSDANTCHGHVGDVFEGVLAIGQISKLSSLAEDALQSGARCCHYADSGNGEK